MKRTISSVLFALPLALVACGGDDGGITVVPDAEPDNTPDACVSTKPQGVDFSFKKDGERLIVMPDTVVEHGACQATADYGAATLMNMQAIEDQEDVCAAFPDYLEVLGLLNTETTPDVFDLQLYKGYGAFETGEITTGTFTLSGDELNFATCGVCALVFADVDTATGTPGSVYMATGGTVTITSVAPNLTGSVSNLTFVHVDVNTQTGESTPNADNCPSAITSVSFDAVVEPA